VVVAEEAHQPTVIRIAGEESRCTGKVVGHRGSDELPVDEPVRAEAAVIGVQVELPW